ncbi:MULTISPECIES: MFS transporter [Xenorhabdus]|uniref:Florfenicol-chloramphenicol exporter n=1 Tax=Xenorhabdus ehlersii TaxID=290111 RepID=A0A2D0IYY5_9GAMM|nr:MULTISPECIES: MFS transporter [Xenorhabdus]MBC8947420.1 florfenicol-chloramphenicol exporter [Xenorhabdus sp. TS4]PHM27180.1 florfenicol-chloramphenicol exporter [Xenorhabdus ehlersii]RKE92407.1 putative MFS family arabinose efflux permease [Xenorhabdus ehlersii]
MNRCNSIRNVNVIFYLVCFSALLGSLAQNIYVPVIPTIQELFNAPLPLVNLTVSAFTFVLAIMQIVYGPLADSKGRKAILLPALIISVIGSIGCAMASDIYWLIAFRIVQAIGIAAIPVIAATIIGDLYEEQHRAKAISTYQMLLTLTPALGPLLGGYLAELNGYVAIFQFIAVIGGLILISNSLWLPETKPETIPENKPKQSASAKRVFWNFGQILSDRIAQSVFCIGFMLFYCYFCFLTFLPIILNHEYDFSPADIGWMYIPISLAMIVGSYSYRLLHHRLSKINGLIVSSLLNLALILLFSITYRFGIPTLIIVTALYGFTLGISTPTHATLLLTTFVEERATVIGLYNFIRYMGMAVGPMVGSFLLFNDHYEWVFLMGALLFAVSIGFTAIMTQQHRKRR